MTDDTALQFKGPEFLTRADSPVHRIRCPIHGFIHFSENERKVIDHWLFQRLRLIRQLALTEYVYPGATHTRFEHSFGAMEVATRFFDAINLRRGEIIEDKIKDLPEFHEKPLDKARQVVRLAALLHDIGHICFSHASEHVLLKGGNHETLTVDILKEKDLLGTLIDDTFWPGCSELVAKVLDKGEPSIPQIRFLRDIISGEMDADRTDYLIRDSHHCGVDYGRFDFRRLIECVDVVEEEGGLELALREDGIHTFEALIMARFQINTQIICHRLRRLYDIYLREYFSALGDDAPQTRDDLLKTNDIEMLARIVKDADSANENVSRWAKRIKERRHHKTIFDTGVGADAMDLSRIRKLKERLESQYDRVDFLLDDRSGATIHNLWKPGERQERDRIVMKMVMSDQETKTVNEESIVFRNIPHNFDCYRVYADPGPEKQALLSELRKSSRLIWNELRGR